METRDWINLGFLLVGVILIFGLTPWPHGYPLELGLTQPPSTSFRVPPQRYQYRTAHFMYGLWDTGPIPDHLQRNIDAWGRQGWTIKVWNRDMVMELIHKYPACEQILPWLKRKVYLADMARLLAVYDEGGHYFDLDTQPEPRRNLLEHLNRHQPSEIFYAEHEVGVYHVLWSWPKRIRKGVLEHPVRLANLAFGACPGNAFIKANIDLLVQRCTEFKDDHDDYAVLFKTGPMCTTDSVKGAHVVDGEHWFRHKPEHSWTNNKDS